MKVTGTAGINDAKWDVHFESATTSSDSQITATSGPTITANTVSYGITLEENKTYKMDIVVKNAGTYEAKLSELKLTGAEDYSFIHYSTTGMIVNDTILAGQTKTITLTVSMDEITNDNISNLENGLTLTLTAEAKFVEANNN